MRGWGLLLFGLLLVIGGSFVASRVQTAGGTRVSDIRFAGDNGATLRALLYVPAGVSPASKAPAILAVHGYINSAETQSAFAIEFARRGYVVLALDQAGHGYSSSPAFGNGFGG
ncbi:MAG: serine aminopeptidase domain-containing protein, partial [Polymorphobacter sp.]